MKTISVIKVGGNIIDDPKALEDFAVGFGKIPGPKLLVHGGGKLATKLAKKMGIPVTMNQGRRITDAQTLDIITMVYAGSINKNIVAQLQSHDCNALGFSGADGNAILSKKRAPNPINYGYVGDVSQVNTATLELLLASNITPVFCAITHDGNGQLLNTNADTIAAELAIALSQSYEVSLYYCFEKNGLLRDVSNETSVIEQVNTELYQQLLKEGIIAEGMLPKMTNCYHALHNGVSKVCLGKPEMLFAKNTIFTTLIK